MEVIDVFVKEFHIKVCKLDFLVFYHTCLGNFFDALTHFQKSIVKLSHISKSWYFLCHPAVQQISFD